MSSNRRMQSIDRHFRSQKSPRARRIPFPTKEEGSEDIFSKDKQDGTQSSPVPGTGCKSEVKSQKKIREEAIAEKRRTRESSRTETELQSFDLYERFGDFGMLASYLAPSPVSEAEEPTTDKVKRTHKDAFRSAVDVTDSTSGDDKRVTPRPVARRHSESIFSTSSNGAHNTDVYQHQALPTGLRATEDDRVHALELLPADGRLHPELDTENIELTQRKSKQEKQYPDSVFIPRATQKSETSSPISSSRASPETYPQDTHASRRTGREPSACPSLNNPWPQRARKIPSFRQMEHEERVSLENAQIEVEKEELKALLWFLIDELKVNGVFFEEQLIEHVRTRPRKVLKEKSTGELLRMLEVLESLEVITSETLTKRSVKCIKWNKNQKGDDADINTLMSRIDKEYPLGIRNRELL